MVVEVACLPGSQVIAVSHISHFHFIGGDYIGGVRTIAVISVWCMMCVVFGVWSLTGLSSQQIFLSEIFCRVIL